MLGPEIRDPERKPLDVASQELKTVDQDGFVPLFNGKDFAGMGDPSREDFAGSRVIQRDNGVSWVVKDGAITGQVWNNVRMFDNMLIIGRKGSVFRNFHLRVNMAINRGGHATVVARNAVREVRPDYLTWKGYGVSIDGGRGSRDRLRSGSITNYVNRMDDQLLASTLRENVTPPRWFILEVIGRGNHFEVLIDGQKVIDWIDSANLYPDGGIFGLRLDNAETVVKLRRIEVKELP